MEGDHVTAASSRESSESLPPLSSSATIAPANRPRAWFDDGIKFAIKEEARLRAPDRGSRWRHRVGFAGELTTSAHFHAPVNRRIYEDYIGDDGYDIEITLQGEKRRIETKTVCNGDLELIIDHEKIDCADYFVLCRTPDPTAMVELVGWIKRPDLKIAGETYPGDTKVRVEPQYLCCFEPGYIPPDQIRRAQIF